MADAPKHDWKFRDSNTNNGKCWYKCSICGASDWIASYGTVDQLKPKECKSIEVKEKPVKARNCIVRIYGSEDTTQFRIELTEEELLTVKRIVANCRIAAVYPNQPTMEIYLENSE